MAHRIQDMTAGVDFQVRAADRPLPEPHPERKPILYRLIRVVMKAAMAVFFQKIELRNGHYVPERGPVVFVANHPNSIMDAFVMGVVTKRKVNYMGHAGLFSGRLKSWFLRSCGVIPVYRPEDAPDRMEENVAAFEACFQALERGETVGIFPEGASDMLRAVKRVRTGAARIVLEAERRNGYGLGVSLIPIGLYFFSRSRFRSRVLVNVGKPIELTPFFKLNEQDNYEAVRQLTAEIQRRLERLTVNVRNEELDRLARDIEQIYRDELRKERANLPGELSRTAKDFILAQQIAQCVDYYCVREPEKVRQLQEQIRSYQRKLQRLRVKDTMLREKVTLQRLLTSNLVSAGRVLLGFPLAAYGIANNLVPYCITEYIARRFVDERTKILSALLLGGGTVFLAFYFAQTALVGFFGRPWWAALYLLSLPLAGLFALSYLKEVRAQRERIAFSLFFLTQRQLLNRLRRERRKLVLWLDELKNAYLRATGLRDFGPEDAQTEPGRAP